MDYYAAPLAALIEQFAKLPGIGRKTAGRLAFYTLNLPEGEAEAFANTILDARRTVRKCEICQNLTDLPRCAICTDTRRDPTVICVVEQPKDVITLEKTHEYHGLYHVLHGAISPMDNISPEDICAAELLPRLADGTVKEVIMATNPTIEGEATAMYLARLVKPLGVKVTQIARGIPEGGDLEYADDVTITRALEGRREM